MNIQPLKIVVIGRSITSSWSNEYAPVYRSLIKGLNKRGHDTLFLERDSPWNAVYGDIPGTEYGRVEQYAGVSGLRDCYGSEIRRADIVIVGSDTQDAADVGRWVLDTAHGITAFYGLDTIATLADMSGGDRQVLSQDLISRYRLFLSSSGGRILDILSSHYGAPAPRAFYYSVEPGRYYPNDIRKKWDMGFLSGTNYIERQVPNMFIMGSASQWNEGRFVLVGSQYSEPSKWPANIERIKYLYPHEYGTFYNAQRFMLSFADGDAMKSGYSPGMRIFEAASCGVPVITNYWEGLESFFELGKEILVACSPDHVLHYLKKMPEEERMAVGARARARILRQHSSDQRAAQLENYVSELYGSLKGAVNVL